MGGADFVRPIRPGDLVEVHARLTHTTAASMNLVVEVRCAAIHGEALQDVVHCVAVYTAVDADGAPREIDRWTPETPGDIALAQRAQAHIDAARAAQ